MGIGYPFLALRWGSKRVLGGGGYKITFLDLGDLGNLISFTSNCLPFLKLGNLHACSYSVSSLAQLNLSCRSETLHEIVYYPSLL
jgi:hypothetical protein